MKNIIVYVSGGYKIDNGHGKFLFDGRAWSTLRSAEDFCIDNGIEYSVA